MISPLASIAPGAKIGKNVIIQPFAYIEDNVEIGDDCIIMPYASVLNGTRLGKGNKVYQIRNSKNQKGEWLYMVPITKNGKTVLRFFRSK